MRNCVPVPKTIYRLYSTNVSRETKANNAAKKFHVKHLFAVYAMFVSRETEHSTFYGEFLSETTFFKSFRLFFVKNCCKTRKDVI